MSDPYAVPSPVGPGGPPPPHGKPNNYLVHSILATFCCCLPLGIVAIVFAAQVDGKWNSGDWRGAQEMSDKAKLFCWISLGLGIAVTVLSIGLQSILVFSEMN